MTNLDLQKYFSECCRVEQNVIHLGSAQLSREDYLQVKKLLESRGGKWKGGKTFGFVFDSNENAEAVYTSICNGDLENKKNLFQFFPTPDNIADRMVEKLDISSEIAVKILEPSAGRGALIKAVHRKFPNIIVDAYEINPDCYYALEQLQNTKIHKSDFMDMKEEQFDYIIANPPFAKNADIKHFRKMFSVLKKGGKLCCILSGHAIEAREREVTEFKDWLYSLNPDIEELPAGTFKEAGTDVRTFMVTLIK